MYAGGQRNIKGAGLSNRCIQEGGSRHVGKVVWSQAVASQR
jgi:hypothetical protein